MDRREPCDPGAFAANNAPVLFDPLGWSVLQRVMVSRQILVGTCVPLGTERPRMLCEPISDEFDTPWNSAGFLPPWTSTTSPAARAG